MKKILIAGDSFSADWSSTYEWWKMLPYEITNISQAGSSEFKILKRIQEHDLTPYDGVIVFHTSPYRLYTETNLLHKDSQTHSESCYVINDVLSKRGPIKSAMNKYLEYFYNDEYNMYCHQKICNDIIEITKQKKVLHCSGFNYDNICTIPNIITVDDLHREYKGSVCHLNQNGNRYLKERIYQNMEKLLG